MRLIPLLLILLHSSVISGAEEECENFISRKNNNYYESCLSHLLKDDLNLTTFVHDDELFEKLISYITEGEYIYIKFGIQLPLDGEYAEIITEATGDSIKVSPISFLRATNNIELSKIKMKGLSLATGGRYVDDVFGLAQEYKRRQSALETVKVEDLNDIKVIYLDLISKELSLIVPMIEEQARTVYQSRFSITASSVLEHEKPNFWVKNLVDKNKDTAWCEGVDTEGVGEYLEIMVNPSNKSKINIINITLRNGYQKSEQVFFNNARIKRLRISIKVQGEKLKFVHDFKDKMEEESIAIPMNISFQSNRLLFSKSIIIKLDIEKIYSGNKYKDLCISEINIDMN